MTLNTLHIKQYEIEKPNGNMVLEEVWEKNKNSVPVGKRQSVLNVLLNKLSEATDIVCITSSTALPKEILHEIPKLAQKGVRVYLLLNSFEDSYEKFIENKAIVRINSEVTGLMVLIDPQIGAVTNGGYLFGSAAFNLSADGIEWYTSLNGEQLKEAFHYFTWSFWEAKEEIRGSITSSPTESRSPFDIYPLLEPESFYYNNWEWKYLKNKVMEVVENARYSLAIGLASFEDYEELFPVLNEKAQQGIKISIYTGINVSHAFIKRFDQSDNIKIYSLAELDNYFVLTDDASGLFLSGSIYTQSEMGISLSPKSVQDLYERLNTLRLQAWVFHRQVLLGEVKGEEVIFEKYNNKMEAHQIRNREVVEHGTFQAEGLRQYFAGTFRPVIKQGFIMSKTIVHKWKVEPAILDEKAKIDPLYGQWEKETSRIINYLEQVLAYAKKVKQEKKEILGSLIGKFFKKDDYIDIEKLITSLESALEEMKLKTYRWENLSALITSVNNYAQKLLEQQLELYDQQEYYEKKEKWQGEKRILDAELQEFKKTYLVKVEKKDSILFEMNKKDPELEKEIDEIKAEIKEADDFLLAYETEHEPVIQAKRTEEKILELCNLLDSEIKKFNNLRNKEKKKHFDQKIKPLLEKEMQSIQKSSILEEILNASKITDSKQNMQYVMKELATHKELRNEMSDEVKGIVNEHKKLIAEKVHMEQNLEKLKNADKKENKENISTLNNLEKELRKLEENIDQLNKRLEQIGVEFRFVPKKKNISLPFESFMINLPDEKIPLVGELYRSGKKRKLAIMEEGQLDQAEKEAERLEAELVLKI